MSAFLFVSDLDNTFVGNDTTLTTLQQYLTEHRTTYGTKVVYATGRSLQLYKELAEEKSLMTPDALITSVGTEIYLDSFQKKYDQQWSEILSQGWNRNSISEIASQFTSLTSQPESEQNPFKLSYYLSEKDAVTVIPNLKANLSQNGLQTKLVYSGSQDLDILPINGDKGLALQYLRQKWLIEPEKTVACGDSGNDIALFQGMERGIIVGNAKTELRQWYISHQKPHHYLSTASYAGGILEGLKHFGFLSEQGKNNK
ncbi:MAG: sucrose-phosphate phosphatase [Microcystaceae cyanobacterium]